ncbi:DUF3955 domain-containing protein [Dethiothermospora halolimnae]|uniref:DUF3955 domain-containing protein n=1 Tax=Dethiothermospora halolimnae TaxID=3114390 RepID=UPI003CCB98EE
MEVGFVMKKYILSLISFIVGIGCMIAYNIIGSEVALDGTLEEPFFLIPIGYLFIAVGLIIGIIVKIRSIPNSNEN